MNKIIITLLLLLEGISFSQVKTTENLQWELGSIEVSYKVIDSVKYSTSQTKVLGNLPRVAISYKVTELKPHATLYAPSIILYDKDNFELATATDFNDSKNTIVTLSYNAKIMSISGRASVHCDLHYQLINGECKYHHDVSLPIGATFINDSTDTWVCRDGWEYDFSKIGDYGCEVILPHVQEYESIKDTHQIEKLKDTLSEQNTDMQKDNSKGSIFFLFLSVIASAIIIIGVNSK
jgi:hypothetical protein